jgi:subtilase family serine protease
VINSFNGGSTATALGNWLASTYPKLFGASNPYTGTSLAGLTNAGVAQVYLNLWNPSGVTKNTYVQAFAVALGVYADSSSLGWNTTAQQKGFVLVTGGGGSAMYNVGSNGAAFGVANNTSLPVSTILQTLNNNFTPSTGLFYGGDQTKTSAANNVFNGINTTGDITNAVSLSAPEGSVAYTPAQVRAAYGISNLSLDGTGQTIAIVDAYDNPNIFESLDAFDTQFGLTASGPTLAQQYGPASSFLTVLGQSGQRTSLPATDPSGAGNANWELEAALDVEWVHAIAPGAQIVLVEANSQSLSDLMASVGTAASQPGVSVVTMSWGFPEGQAVFAADEANYDSVFNVPGVTFLASTGDYGTADPEYPAFSPNVVAVGGTTLNLNSDQSYNSETGWGYYADSLGTSIGSGGGLSLYQPEPAYQQGVQSTGSRTTPDVSLIADPATGGWIADTYNLSLDNPYEVAGGTSLSSPAFAGLMLLVNQGRVAAGQAVLNSGSPTEAQQALYSLPQRDYNVIASGSNGYNANTGYNLVTGLGTPVANLMVPDLIAYQGPGTTYAGPTVSPLQDASLSSTWATGGSITNAFNVFSALTTSSRGFSEAQSPVAANVSRPASAAPTLTLVNLTPTVAATTTPAVATGSTFALSIGSFSLHGQAQSLSSISNSTSDGLASQPLVGVTNSSTSTGLVQQMPSHSTLGLATSSSNAVEHLSRFSAGDHHNIYPDVLRLAKPWTGLVSDSVLDEVATQLTMSRTLDGATHVNDPSIPPAPATMIRDASNPTLEQEQDGQLENSAARVVVLGLAAGVWASGAGIMKSRKRPSGSLFSRGKSKDFKPGKESW